VRGKSLRPTVAKTIALIVLFCAATYAQTPSATSGPFNGTFKGSYTPWDENVELVRVTATLVRKGRSVSIHWMETSIDPESGEASTLGESPRVSQTTGVVRGNRLSFTTGNKKSRHPNARYTAVMNGKRLIVSFKLYYATGGDSYDATDTPLPGLKSYTVKIKMDR
jgi:hypothetical protein